MRAYAVSEEDRTASVMPAVVSGMPWRVTAVAALPEFRLRVRFLDGTEGEVDVAPLIRSANAGVFAALAGLISLQTPCTGPSNPEEGISWAHPAHELFTRACLPCPPPVSATSL